LRVTLFGFAKRNLRRKIFRSVAIAVSVAVVAGTLFSVTTVMESVELSLKRGTARLGADLMVVPADSEQTARAALLAGEPSTFYMPSSLVEKIRAVKGVQVASPQLFLESASYACCDVAEVRLIGFDPATDFTITPWVKQRLDRPLEPDEILIGREVTYDVGGSMTYYGQRFKIAGYLELTGMRFLDNSVFMPLDTARRMIAESGRKAKQELHVRADQVSAVLVQIDPKYSPEQVAIYIEHDVDGVKAVVSEEVISSVRKQLFVLLRSILVVSAILWIMALLMIGVIFSMIVNERQREMGLLRAMGARRAAVFRLILTEASTLSLLGGIAGIAAGGVLLFTFKNLIRASLNVPYLWPQPLQFGFIIGFCLVLALVTGVGAALYPAFRISRMEPYAAIRQGE